MRILTWTVPSPQYARHYMEKAYTPVGCRIYAENAPTSGDLVVDIKDDGVSIFKANEIIKLTPSSTVSSIEYNTLATSTASNYFIAGETITGNSASVTSQIIKDNHVGSMTVNLDIEGTVHTVGETITGGTSLVTAVVVSWNAREDSVKTTIEAGQQGGVLPATQNAEPLADDFKPDDIEEGSWLSFEVVETNGANGITVQLELDEI